MKFKSSRLKEYEYNITQTFEDAKLNGEIIALADNQILRSIRYLQNKVINKEYLEELFTNRDKLRRKNHSKDNVLKIQQIQKEINDMMFIPDYITIVMEHPSHYKYLFENGLILNSKKYIRFSCSASQARVSTVVFCEEEISRKLKVILDNGRNLNKELNPSKYNAYLGVSGSATKEVSTPKFCVVPDCLVNKRVKANYVTETELNKDDIIEVKEVEQEFNLFDGQGLISYNKAAEWASELGLDYVPAQWCIRQNYIKGMLCVFDIHDFCKDINNGNYIIETIYKNPDGTPKLVDLRDIDVILSESQFKLWDSFPSLEIYQENCKKNNLVWGVSLYSPKEDKNILKMNYQFNQTLKWNDEDIKNVCQKFVDWISGVSVDNIYYTILFLLGKNVTKEKIEDFLKNSNNYWVKSLVINHDLIKDKHIKKKIYDLIKNRIKRGCLGDIIVDGNFQTLVSDPYAMMQHVCGLEVTGLLKKNEYYSNYWNQKDVKFVNSMRPPLTFRSEHLKLNLIENEGTRYWYKYCYTGIIVNIFGMETLHWAGSDFDYDQVATTSDITVLSGIYENELPVVYSPPKAGKKKITQTDLFNADLFAFGSIIGSITNKSTTGYALLPLFNENSQEYKTIINRLKMCTKLQSAQIDKAKIGKEVKGIPKGWVEYQKINEDDCCEVKMLKEFNNSILLDKHPYFFIYLYKDTHSRYKKYINSYDLSCRQKFNISLNELLNKKRKTEAERSFIDIYNKFLPVIDSNCVMNYLCKYIESIDFDIKSKIKLNDYEDIYNLYIDETIQFDEVMYSNVLKEYKKFNKNIKDLGNMGIYNNSHSNKFSEDIGQEIDGKNEEFKYRMNNICSNIYELTNYLVKIFYVDHHSSNKDLLWNTYGEYIFNNLKKKNGDTSILFPLPDKFGDIIYLNDKYSLQEVNIE